jgi:uncharacterized protein YdiU (UPF0061 family)
MEYFNPRLVSNHSDNEARYRYEEQPKTCKWNLMRLSEALDPLLPIEWSSNFLNTHFDELYSQTYLGQMALKLGFVTSTTSSDKKSLEDHEFDLIQSFFVVMQETSADFTNTFRTLSLLSRDPSDKETLKTV